MFDTQNLNIPCPQCGQKVEKSVGWIKANDSYVCPGCSGLVSLDKQGLIAGLNSADKALDAFRKSIRKLGK